MSLEAKRDDLLKQIEQEEQGMIDGMLNVDSHQRQRRRYSPVEQPLTFTLQMQLP